MTDEEWVKKNWTNSDRIVHRALGRIAPFQSAAQSAL
jgi:hypothetical protein